MNEELPRYDWTEHKTKSGRAYLQLNDNPEYVIFNSGLMWCAGKKFGNCKTIEDCKAMVEGLFDHFSLPKNKRWMTI